MIYRIPYRLLPKNGLVSSQYKNNSYVMSDYKSDFEYYENTDIRQIEVDEHHLIPWCYFSSEGVNYLIPRIIFSIQNNISDISINIQDFINNLIYEDSLKNSLMYLSYSELVTLKDFFEWLLFYSDAPENIFGENTLINNIEYIENLINAKIL